MKFLVEIPDEDIEEIKRVLADEFCNWDYEPTDAEILSELFWAEGTGVEYDGRDTVKITKL